MEILRLNTGKSALRQQPQLKCSPRRTFTSLFVNPHLLTPTLHSLNVFWAETVNQLADSPLEDRVVGGFKSTLR